MFSFSPTRKARLRLINVSLMITQVTLHNPRRPFFISRGNQAAFNFRSGSHGQMTPACIKLVITVVRFSQVCFISVLILFLHSGYLCSFYQFSGLWDPTHRNYAPINSKIEHPPPPGIPRAFDFASCPGRGEFEPCVGRVGNLNRIYLLFWRNTFVRFFGFCRVWRIYKIEFRLC